VVHVTEYRCGSFGCIRLGEEYDGCIVESPKDAAHVFASRYARREFGEQGQCWRVQLRVIFANGGYCVCQAVIGAPHEGVGASGQDLWFTICVDPPIPTSNFGAWQ
jgi:hypothetical protein